MALFLRGNHFAIFVFIFGCSLSLNFCDARYSLDNFKSRVGMKLSYYNTDADSLDLPTLDAYDNSWLLAPSSYGGPPINLISNPPGISPSPNLSPSPSLNPNPNEMSPISDPPLSGPSPSPSNSFRSPTGPTLTRLAPTGAPRHRWGKQYAIWCVARPTVPETVLQRAMDYACGNGADCGSVQPSGPCYVPNTLVAHASFAFNSYWQRTKIVGGTCDFGGTAMLITDDPSFNGCHYMYN